MLVLVLENHSCSDATCMRFYRAPTVQYVVSNDVGTSRSAQKFPLPSNEGH